MKHINSVRCAALVALMGAALSACGSPVKDDPAATAAATPSPSATSVTVTVAPSPSATEAPQYASDVIDDGIGADEYPPLAPERGEGFPQAYEMEDWVWDKAGAGWSVAIVTDTGWEEDGSPLQPAEVYLVSSEGAYFDLFTLGSEYSDNAVVATWRESDHVAMVLWGGIEGGELNLDTGAMDPLEFRVGEGTSTSVIFLASEDDGVELWSAGDGTQTRHFRWSPAGGYEAVLDGQTDIYGDYYGGSPNGESLQFGVWSQDYAYASDRSGPDGRPNFVVYSLASGESRTIVPAWPTDATQCYLSTWRSPEELGAYCYYPEDATADYLELVVDVATGAVSEPPANLVGSVEYAQNAMGEAAEVTLASGVVLVSEPDSQAVFEVRVPTPDGHVTVADSTNYLLRSGGSLAGAVEVAPGVLRLDLATTVLLIDLGTGETVALMSARTAAGDPTRRTTLAFYGEFAEPGIGSWGYCGSC